MLGFIAENAAKLTTTYGNVSKASIGAIQRQLLVLENQGGRNSSASRRSRSRTSCAPTATAAA